MPKRKYQEKEIMQEICIPCKPEKRTFASHPRASEWSDKNLPIRPCDVAYSAHKKFIFNCKCGHEFETNPHSIKKGCKYCSGTELCKIDTCERCYQKSFASHPRASEWSTKNIEMARQVRKSSTVKSKFNCTCGHEFTNSPNGLRNGCTYCNSSGGTLCEQEDCEMCLENSFASHPGAKEWSPENKLSARQVRKSSGLYFKFNCVCGHPYITRPCKHMPGCVYCTKGGNGLLCDKDDCKMCLENSFASHPHSAFWCPTNDFTPREIRKCSTQKMWVICEKKHRFETYPANVSLGRWCPDCYLKTEAKLFAALVIPFPSLLRQFTADWCKSKETGKHLRFDFALEEHKIIIELDGRQHFKQVRNWKPPEDQHDSDKYKEECANSAGYSTIRLLQEDVWDDKFVWLERLCHAIEKLSNASIPENMYIDEKGEYSEF